MKVFTITAALALAVSAVSALDLTIRNDVPGNATSPLQYGIMYEDINRCGDSGIYNQMLRNWNFQASDNGSAPTTEFWSAIGEGASITLDNETPLNKVNKNSLRLDISSSASDRVGIANEGWWGLRVQPDEKYKASFFAKSSAYSGPLNVTLETSSGQVLASTAVKGLSNEFQKFEVTLSPSVSKTSIDNKFVVSVDGASAQGASINFQVFTLFGETYKDRENGLRKDLAEVLMGMNPSFFRFPGGNNMEGQTIPVRWKWNETIGPLEERVGRMGDWTYWNTNGQGLLDYMYMCEDMGMEPILGVYAGYSLKGDSVPEDELEPYIQEVLNELEYLTGDSSTTYGKLRAEHGREEPFKLQYIEIGNEDFFSTTYNYRYKAYYDAIKKKYPDLKFIETTSQDERPWDIIDDHYYNNVPDMIADFDHYDNWPRNGTGVFVGEFGTNVKGCCGDSPANMQAALADAVFITGLERNADLVKMIAYAPTMKREGHEQWNPDIVHFDTESIWLTPSYYAFQMWSKNRADTILQVDATNGGFDPLYWVVGSRKDTKQIFVKMVNTGNSSETVNFQLQNAAVHSEGVAQTLTGDLDAENTKDKTVVKPVEKTFKLAGKSSFSYTFEANSVTVLLLHEM